ncbi:MAG: ABC transporter substrate-binding protein [Thermomicrobiales bacterium]|nr:ABC transporter substrate-binding protein [Thermomicrobiales bacterium]
MADLERLTSLGISRRAFVRLAGVAAALPVMGGLLAACGGDDDDSADGGSSSGGEATTGTGDATAETGGEEPTAGGELIVGLDSEPPTLDPHTSPSAVSFMITSSVSESLTFLTEERELKPWLAESWEASTDGTSYTFKLREDVTFQDGSPFNAESIKGNFDRIVDPNFQAGSALASLAGYTGTDTPDEFTAVVNFEAPYAPFLTYTAGAPLGIVSLKAVEELGDDFATQIVTTGQFKVESYTAKDNVALVRWDEYNRQAPWAEAAGPALLDRIVFKFIPESSTRVTTVETGETQLITGVPAQDLARLEGNGDLSVQKMLWGGIPRILILNTSMEPTDDVNVRRAVSLAIDRQALVDTVFAGIGEVSIGMLTRAMIDDESLSQPYDPEQAKQLLEEAGWTGDGTREKDGKKLSFLLNVIDAGSGSPPEAQLIQANLNDVGFDCQIKAQARAPWYEDNYNCATNGPVMFLRSGDYDGLYAMFHSSLIGKNFNFACLDDPEIDSMLEQGRTETDQAARRALYLEICQKLADMAVAAPLVDEYAVWAGKKEVQGLMFNGYTYPQFGLVSIQS